MKKTSKLVFGIIFLILGLLFLLVTLNIIPDISFLENLRNIWPIGFIIAGIFLILKQRALSIVIFIITIILAVIFLLTPSIYYEDNVYTVKETHKIAIEDVTQPLNYDINFREGMLNIAKTQNSKNLVELNINDYKKTYTPLRVIKHEDNSTSVKILRDHDVESKIFLPGMTNRNEVIWDINISNQTTNNINLDYAISETNIDLNGIKVNNLNIDTGISSTEIVYGNYPTNTKIESGISDIDLYFPSNASVKKKKKGGLLDVNLKDFEKRGNIYYSKNFKQDNKTINIVVNSGISSISGGRKDEIKS